MKHRFGGLLCLALGAVLLFTGLNGGASGAVGTVNPTTCGIVVIGGITPCPTGEIVLTSVVDTSATAAATPPSAWSVTVTSACLDPNTSSAVNRTVSVPNGGSATVTDLYVYTDNSSATSCDYQLAQAPVAGFTATFDPASPVTLPLDRGDNARAVTLNDVAAAGTTSAPVSSTAPPPSSSGAAPSSTAAASPTVVATSSPAAPLAATGPRSNVRASVWIGIALCLLGFVLLFGGRVRRTAGRHRD